MFNTTRIEQGPRYPQTITEKRAPTDESVRILSELEQAAEKRVLTRGKLEGNTFNACWTLIHEPYEPDLVRCHCRYELNGVEREFSFHHNPRHVRSSEDFGKTIGAELEKVVKEHLGLALLDQCREVIIPKNRIFS